MQHGATTDRSAISAKAAPLFARLLSKLVLEVLPASLASVIGAALLAHYQFGHPSAAAGAVVAVAPAAASPEMLQLVRDEHDLIRNFIVAQQSAQAQRYAAADAQPMQSATPAQSVQADADAEIAAAIARHAASAVPTKTPARRLKVAAIAPLPASPAPATLPLPATAMSAVAPAPQAAPVLAGLQNSAVPLAPPEQRSLMARILAMKDHVVRAPLHAVMTVGGIPSWIGHRLGSDEPEPGERMFSAAS